MISLVRQYLATIVVCALSLISGVPLGFAAVAIIMTWVGDTTVTKQSDELQLFQSFGDFLTPIESIPNAARAILTLVGASAGSTCLVVGPHLLKMPADLATLCGVFGLALLSIVGSYFGFLWLVQGRQTPKALARRFYRMPDVLGAIEMLPRQSSMVTNGVVRCILGACVALPFGLVALKFDHAMASVDGAFVTLGIAAFYPFAFALISQGFLCIRWSKAAASVGP
jgi:hypothetical protein